MSWLQTIETLAHLLELQTSHWICFLQIETAPVARHSAASDHSTDSSYDIEEHGAGHGSAASSMAQKVYSHHSEVFGASASEPVVRCFFAADPQVTCAEFVARDFYNHPNVQGSSSGAILIPYYAPDEFNTPQASPFLKFSCEDFIEFRGSLGTDSVQLRTGGQLLDRCLESLNTHAQSQQTQTHCPACNDSPPVWQASESKESLREMFSALQKLMLDGESYLANASTRLHGPVCSENDVSLSSFVATWLRAPSRFGVYVGCGADIPRVVCFSPERFIARSGFRIVTEPIKGTAPARDDSALLGADVLWASTKEMCEQKMVTDLLRNDLNSVCVPGSVQVSSPFEVRRAGGLLQMQSVIYGDLQDPHTSHAHILRNMLPAGSVTGTPKFAVGQQLRTLEKTTRGYYTGVFALAEDAFHLESTILIRGFFSDHGLWKAGIGAGITTLSDIDFELNEFELKWQSFAQRWPQKHERLEPAVALEACKPLLHSPISSHEKQHPVTQLSECAPLRNLDALQRCQPDEMLGSILFVDHLDSFSGNLLAALRAQGCPVVRVISSPVLKQQLGGRSSVFSSSAETKEIQEFEEKLLKWVEAGVFAALVLSPGPGRPEDYPLSHRLLARWPSTKPLLGVCLGHQILLSGAGCLLQRAAEIPIHGRSEKLKVVEPSVWLSGVPLQSDCTFYNSWNVSTEEARNQAIDWRVCAESAGSVALSEHQKRPWVGIQFHPESFATVAGRPLLAAFVALCRRGA